jgi:hypothetical protein
MKLFFDSLWRALANCFHGRVMLMSILPMLLMVALTFVPAYFFWTDAQDFVRELLESSELLESFNAWLAGIGFAGLKSVLAPLLVLCLVTPLAVVLSLLAVSVFTTPAMLKLVSERRFAALQKKRGGSFWVSVCTSLGFTVAALGLLVLSIPLWFIPPLVLVLPPLIWGWLTYRVMSYDVLSEHASVQERQALMRKHRLPLLAIGVFTGYLGAVPSVAWVSGLVFVVFSPLLIPLAIWLYTVVFAFSSLWFSHYALSALEAMRQEGQVLNAEVNASNFSTSLTQEK